MPTTASLLPPPFRLASNGTLLSNGTQKYVQCQPRSNVTYPIYDSPLELAITLGHQPIPSWQVFKFLEFLLIDIKSEVARHPGEYITGGYYYYHKPRQLGTVIVIPTLFRRFTWSDLFLVLHGLAEYISKAPQAYEMCVEINFKAGGLAGVIFFDWWTVEAPHERSAVSDRDIGNRRLLKSFL